MLIRELARRAGSLARRLSTSCRRPSCRPWLLAIGKIPRSLSPPRELAAVLAHEIAHIRHGDIFIMRLAATAGAMTQVMASVGLFLLFALLPVLWATGSFCRPSAFCS